MRWLPTGCSAKSRRKPGRWATARRARAAQGHRVGGQGRHPYLYNVPIGSNNHSALYQTLQAWADTYRDGVQGKEAIVVKHALARPQDSTQQDDFVGRNVVGFVG